MPDLADYGRPRRPISPILLLILAAVLIGMGGMAWLFHRFDSVAEMVSPRPVRTVPVIQPARPKPIPLVAAPTDSTDGAVVEQRIEKIEEKLADVDERAATATGEAHRAEGLLVAFAARRAIDRGMPLGYLEGLVRDRFGGVEPRAVATIISASRQPITIDQLRDQLHALEPKLSVGGEKDNWWEGFRRELAGLIVVRDAATPSAAPIDRLDRAQDALAIGHVDAALREVARLPGRAAAEGWIANARRYLLTHAALDRIETAALLKPATAAEPVAMPAPAAQ